MTRRAHRRHGQAATERGCFPPPKALPYLPLLQYPDVRTADMAKQALEGHAMYDGGHNVVSYRCALQPLLVLLNVLAGVWV